MSEKKAPFGQGSRIQSLVFEKRYYDAAHAKKKAKSMGFKADKVDVKANTVRIRQAPPGEFKTFRMKNLNKSGTIQAVIGIKHPRSR
jgi:hypothetical protein